MNTHSEGCRAAHTGEDFEQALTHRELLHEILERLDRLTLVAERGADIVGPLIRSRIAKFAGGRAVAKVEAQWREDREDRR